MANCPMCSRFHTAFVKPICDRTDCPVPADERADAVDDGWHDTDPRDEWDEDDDDGFDDCGLTSDGICTLAGTEHCDWDCPHSR